MENRTLSRRLAPLAAGLALALAGATEASAQHLEAEPNHPCTSAQDLTAATLPATVAGSLDTPPATPDVDFYRFSATPGNVVTIRHSQAGAQPLGDPYLAILNGQCGYMVIDSDGGGGVNAMARITVPADGVFVVAAAASGDWSFTGDGGSSGTYVVSVQEEQAAQSISGRLVNSRTGQPAVFAFLTLQRCSGGECEDAGSTYSSYDGTFRFVSGDWSVHGQPLLVGDYQITAFLASYQEGVFGPYSLGEGQALDLGDIRLAPVPNIGSLRGRAVDEITGAPLSGTSAPFSYADLELCPETYSFCYAVRRVPTDGQGAFRFESTEEAPLFAGKYRVKVWADQYEDTASAIVTLGDSQHFDLGDVRVKSYPVRVNLVESCGAIPDAGGHCRFTVEVANGSHASVAGEAWSMVTGNYIGTPGGRTVFQVGTPRTLSLAPGAKAAVPYSFYVPGSIGNGAYICVTGYAGQKPHNIETLGKHDLFCLTKGVSGFALVPEEHKRDVVRELRKGGNGNAGQ